MKSINSYRGLKCVPADVDDGVKVRLVDVLVVWERFQYFSRVNFGKIESDRFGFHFDRRISNARSWILQRRDLKNTIGFRKQWRESKRTRETNLNKWIIYYFRNENNTSYKLLFIYFYLLCGVKLPWVHFFDGRHAVSEDFSLEIFTFFVQRFGLFDFAGCWSSTAQKIALRLLLMLLILGFSFKPEPRRTHELKTKLKII